MDYNEKGEIDDPRDNLNTKNWATQPSPRDPRSLGSLGNKAIFTPETTSEITPGSSLEVAPEPPLRATSETIPGVAPESIQNSPESITPEVAETPLVMPPGAEQLEPATINPEILTPQSTPDLPVYDFDKIKTTDRATPETIDAARGIVSDFNHDGDAEKLVERYYDLVDTNLSNSYADREASRQRIQDKQSASSLQKSNPQEAGN